MRGGERNKPSNERPLIEITIERAHNESLAPHTEGDSLQSILWFFFLLYEADTGELCAHIEEILLILLSKSWWVTWHSGPPGCVAYLSPGVTFAEL